VRLISRRADRLIVCVVALFAIEASHTVASQQRPAPRSFVIIVR
jgi:hypothetical protein